MSVEKAPDGSGVVATEHKMFDRERRMSNQQIFYIHFSKVHYETYTRKRGNLSKRILTQDPLLCLDEMLMTQTYNSVSRKSIVNQ